MIVLGATVAALALGQTAYNPPHIELEQLELDPAAQSSLVVGGGQVLEPGSYRLGLGLHYEHDPLLLDVNGQRAGAVVANRLTAHVFGAFGVVNHLEIDAQVPIIAYQNGDNLQQYGVSALPTGGLDTPWLAARYQFLSSWNAPVDLAAQLGLGLPLGTAGALGNGGFSVEPRVMASRSFHDIVYSAQLGAVIRPSNDVGSKQVGSNLGLEVAAAWKAVEWRPEIAARLTVPFTDYPPAVELLAGARYPIGSHVEAFGLVGPGFGTLPGTPAFRALLGIAFREEPPARGAANPP